MSALTADKIRLTRGEQSKVQIEAALVTGQTVYVGSLVSWTTSGRVRAADNATGQQFAGVVEEIVNDTNGSISTATGNAAGTVRARIAYGHEVELDVRTAARTFTNLGKTVFADSDDDVTDATGAGTAAVRVRVGQLKQFTLANRSRAFVLLGVFGSTDAT
ncbi:MAG: hypothetical protein HC927_10815 [Deltaproteobacteria bacterium]|nr:hypothetical protein [Deltaproteobacteria bacterium]